VPAPTFDPAATLRALGHDLGRETALSQVDRLQRRPADRAQALAYEGGALPAALARLSADATARMAHRLRAVEVLAGLAGADAVPALAERLRHTGTPEETAVARTAAIALRGLDAAAALAPAATADDPEIRATVAAAGAAPDDLCIRLTDAWPFVRAAAARGLARHPDRAACLAGAMQDPQPTVRSAVIQAAGFAGVAAVAPGLRTIAGDAGAPVPLRVEAVVALGRLGDDAPALRILNTHLEKGGIVPLAEAAVGALAARDTPENRAHLRRALLSEAGGVVLAAARGLSGFGDTEALPDLRAARDRVGARYRSPLDRVLEHLGDPPRAEPLEPGGPDPADVDPE
jgi:HEAT repeat protein